MDRVRAGNGPGSVQKPSVQKMFFYLKSGVPYIEEGRTNA